MAELAQLPADPEHKFAAMEEVMRQRFDEEMDSADHPAAISRLRFDYMSGIRAAAETLGIADIAGRRLPGPEDVEDHHFHDFSAAVNSVTLKLALRTLKDQDDQTVELRPSARRRLKELLDELRTQVDELDLTTAKRSRLHKQIDKFQEELEKERLTVAQLAALTLLILGHVADVGGAGDTAAGIIHSIESVVAVAQRQEEALDETDKSPRLLEGPKTAALSDDTEKSPA